MNVIKFEDYRAPEKTGPCTVSFIGFPFKTPEGVEYQMNLSVTVGDGDFAGIIDTVKENGGAYLPFQEGDTTFWFLPWPCAMIRISFSHAQGV